MVLQGRGRWSFQAFLFVSSVTGGRVPVDGEEACGKKHGCARPIEPKGTLRW